MPIKINQLFSQLLLQFTIILISILVTVEQQKKLLRTVNLCVVLYAFIYIHLLTKN